MFADSSSSHDRILYDLNQSYQEIQRYVEELEELKHSVSEKIERFSGLYGELVKENKTKTLLFCLDSLYFQYRISRINYESIENISNFVLNRMYGDYYRLWRLIQTNSNVNIEDFSNTNINNNNNNNTNNNTNNNNNNNNNNTNNNNNNNNNNNTNNNNNNNTDADAQNKIVCYRDLDVFAVYPMQSVYLLHEQILIILQKFFIKWAFGARGVDEYIENKVSILPISNYLNTLQHENHILEHQTMLYVNYLAFFHVSQKRSLNKLKTRLSILEDEIDACLKCDRILTVEDLFSNSPFCSRASSPRSEIGVGLDQDQEQNICVHVNVDEFDTFFVGDIEIPYDTGCPTNSPASSETTTSSEN